MNPQGPQRGIAERWRDNRLRYEVGQLLAEQPEGPRGGAMSHLRRWYWIFLRRWETEICGACGRPVRRCTDSWWEADDDLWLKVVGTPWGVLCPPCFTKACRAQGVWISWKAVVGD